MTIDTFLTAVPDLLANLIEEQRKTRETMIEFGQVLGGLRSAMTPADQAPLQDAAPGKPAPAAEKGSKKTTSPSTSEKATAAGTPAASPAPAEISYDQISKAVISVAQKKGRDAAVALLSKFGAGKATELKPEQYADVLAAVEESLA